VRTGGGRCRRTRGTGALTGCAMRNSLPGWLVPPTVAGKPLEPELVPDLETGPATASDLEPGAD